MNYYVCIENSDDLQRLVDDSRIDSSMLDRDIEDYEYPYGMYIQENVLVEWYEDEDDDEMNIDTFYELFNPQPNTEYEMLNHILT